METQIITATQARKISCPGEESAEQKLAPVFELIKQACKEGRTSICISYCNSEPAKYLPYSKRQYLRSLGYNVDFQSGNQPNIGYWETYLISW